MSNKIIRTPTKVAGGITKEEEVLLKQHADMWTKRILSTETADFSKLEPAIKGLYKAANLVEPEVILVKSPIMMVFMFGVCSVLLDKKKANVRQILDDIAAQMNAIPADKPPVEHYVSVCKALAGKKGIDAAKQDRKSTRLNSSH